MNAYVTPHGRYACVFGLAASAVYCTMVFGSLAHLASVSGFVPFDMRPTGYGPDDAQALLAALGEEGRAYYGRVQLLLDALYPALMALTLSNLFRLIGRGIAADSAVRIGVILSWAAAVFDYLENILIGAMLVLWDALPNTLVQAASAATLTKSLVTSAAIVWLIGFLAWRVWRSWRSARRPAL